MNNIYSDPSSLLSSFNLGMYSAPSTATAAAIYIQQQQQQQQIAKQLLQQQNPLFNTILTNTNNSQSNMFLSTSDQNPNIYDINTFYLQQQLIQQQLQENALYQAQQHQAATLAAQQLQLKQFLAQQQLQQQQQQQRILNPLLNTLRIQGNTLSNGSTPSTSQASSSCASPSSNTQLNRNYSPAISVNNYNPAYSRSLLPSPQSKRSIKKMKISGFPYAIPAAPLATSNTSTPTNTSNIAIATTLTPSSATAIPSTNYSIDSLSNNYTYGGLSGNKSNMFICPAGCGKVLNKRSFRSLKKHKETCLLYQTYLAKLNLAQRIQTNPAIATGTLLATPIHQQQTTLQQLRTPLYNNSLPSNPSSNGSAASTITSLLPPQPSNTQLPIKPISNRNLPSTPQPNEIPPSEMFSTLKLRLTNMGNTSPSAAATTIKQTSSAPMSITTTAASQSTSRAISPVSPSDISDDDISEPDLQLLSSAEASGPIIPKLLETMINLSRSSSKQNSPTGNSKHGNKKRKRKESREEEGNENEEFSDSESSASNSEHSENRMVDPEAVRLDRERREREETRRQLKRERRNQKLREKRRIARELRLAQQQQQLLHNNLNNTVNQPMESA